MISELRRCLLRIAIVSGRDTDQLGARIPIDGLTLVGNHGLEQREGDRSRLVPEAKPFVASIERAAGAVARLAEARTPGVTIERKRVTLSVHFRNAPDPEAASAAFGAALRGIADREHLQLRAGRLVWELRPPLEIDKGQVLRRLSRSLRPAAIVYAGDDLTDADAFRALGSMRPDIRTLAIGVRSSEVPDSAFADCDVVVDGVAGINQLLRELLVFCRDNPAPTPD